MEFNISTARNPFDVLARWPTFVDGMRAIRDVVVAQIAKQPDLQNLADACGEHPTREPPRPSSVKKARQAIGKLLGLSVRQAEASHPASPWKFQLVRAI